MVKLSKNERNCIELVLANTFNQHKASVCLEIFNEFENRLGAFHLVLLSLRLRVIDSG